MWRCIMADYRYRLIPTPQKVDSTYLNNIMNILARYPNESFVINFKNTKEFSLTDIRKIDGVSSNCSKVAAFIAFSVLKRRKRFCARF